MAVASRSTSRSTNAKLAAHVRQDDPGDSSRFAEHVVTPPGCTRSSTATASMAGQCLTNNPNAPRPEHPGAPISPTPTRLTPNPKIWTPSINIRVVNADAQRRGGRRDRDRQDGGRRLHDHVPARRSRRPPPRGGGSASMPEPGFPYGSYKICAQSSATGPPRPRRHPAGDRLRRQADDHRGRRDRREPGRRHGRRTTRRPVRRRSPQTRSTRPRPILPATNGAIMRPARPDRRMSTEAPASGLRTSAASRSSSCSWPCRSA